MTLCASYQWSRVTIIYWKLSKTKFHLSTAERWFLEFKKDRTSIQDEPRSGRPSTAVTPDNIATVESLIKEDSRITYEQFAKTLDIGKAAINTILHDHLGVSKLAARWIGRVVQVYAQEIQRRRVQTCL